jgi:hypothetical protein
MNHILEMVIQYALGEFRPIGLPKQLFFVKEYIVDKWFEDDLETSSKIRRGIPIWHCNCNDSLLKTIDTMVSTLSTENQGQSSITWLYHATNWSSVVSILSTGPNFLSGRKCVDFGIGPSFYVTPDLNHALEWCGKRSRMWQNETAIIVFRFDTNEIKKKQLKYYRFETPNADWIRLTKSSRLCRVVKNDLDKYDLVYGPMVANPIEIIQKAKDPKPHSPPSAIKYQYASKSRLSDDLLDMCIRGVLWLSKQ